MGFEKWFGCFNEERKLVIVERIKRQIVFFEGLGLNRFSRIIHEADYRVLFAQAYRTDNSYTVYLGTSFWNTKSLKAYTRETVLIHEISHFKSVGGTIDYGYVEECEELVNDDPRKALYNADSYALFITGHQKLD